MKLDIRYTYFVDMELICFNMFPCEILSKTVQKMFIETLYATPRGVSATCAQTKRPHSSRQGTVACAFLLKLRGVMEANLAE